jgi:hypothetical protein
MPRCGRAAAIGGLISGAFDEPIVLDEHRGMAAQQPPKIRRRFAEVEADQAADRTAAAR